MPTLADIALSALLVLEVLLATLVFCHGTTRTLTPRRRRCARGVGCVSSVSL